MFRVQTRAALFEAHLLLLKTNPVTAAPNTNPDSFTPWHVDTIWKVKLSEQVTWLAAEPFQCCVLCCGSYPMFTGTLGLCELVGDQRMLKTFQSQCFTNSHIFCPLYLLFP